MANVLFILTTQPLRKMDRNDPDPRCCGHRLHCERSFLIHVLQCRSRVRANLLRLIREWRWWSGGGILSECRGARSVRELCEACLVRESLAPYKTKEVFQIIKYKQSSVDLSKWTVQSGDRELPAVKGHWLGGGDSEGSYGLMFVHLRNTILGHFPFKHISQSLPQRRFLCTIGHSI